MRCYFSSFAIRFKIYLSVFSIIRMFLFWSVGSGGRQCIGGQRCARMKLLDILTSWKPGVFKFPYVLFPWYGLKSYSKWQSQSSAMNVVRRSHSFESAWYWKLATSNKNSIVWSITGHQFVDSVFLLYIKLCFVTNRLCFQVRVTQYFEVLTVEDQVVLTRSCFPPVNTLCSKLREEGKTT